MAFFTPVLGPLTGVRDGAIGRIAGLSLRGFRNLADADLAIPKRGFVIVGPNGHGKTSLIEAALYCEVFRSFRGAADRELVAFGRDGFRVAAAVDGTDATEPERSGREAGQR